MNFKELSLKYEETFDTYPPVLTTLDTDSEEYLKLLEKAIETNEPLTRNELAEVFMTDEEALY